VVQCTHCSVFAVYGAECFAVCVVIVLVATQLDAARSAVSGTVSVAVFVAVCVLSSSYVGDNAVGCSVLYSACCNVC